MKHKYLLLTSLLSFFACISHGQDLKLKSFANGYDQPVGLENAGDHRLFVIEQAGVIQIIDSSGTKNTKPFLDIRAKVYNRGNEQGLLGLAFHPQYTENGLFVLNYTKSGGTTVIAAYQVSNDADIADPNSEKVLLEIDQPYANHNGGGIAFGPDGYLYIGMGDGGWAGDPKKTGQDKKSLLGKMLRIKVEENGSYSIPKDNPFAGNSDYLPEIWAMGVRNPWRFSFDSFNGDLWIADVGQDKWEEIDFQSGKSNGGENYGWRCREGNHDYLPGDCPSGTVLIDPVYEYANNNSEGCSVTGGYVYRGTQYASLFGAYLFTDFCTGNIWLTRKKNGKFNTTLVDQFKRNNYSSFGKDVNGELYLCERETGNIVKLVVSECKPIAHFNGIQDSVVWIKGSSLEAAKGNGFSYDWYLDGNSLNNSTNTIVPESAGTYSCIVKNLRGCADTATLFIKSVVPTSTDMVSLGNASIYPNPVSETLNIIIPRQWPSLDAIEILDLSGKQVLIRKSSPLMNKRVSLKVAALPEGNYLLRIRSHTVQWSYPVTVKR